MKRIEVVVLMVFLFSKIVLMVFLFSKSHRGNKTAKDCKLWTQRFASERAQEFLRSIKCPQQENTLNSVNKIHTKKDEITTNSDSVTKTEVLKFPITEQTKKMMFALLGDRGIFEKDHFKRSREVHIQGPALITVWKIFPNKSAVLNELQSLKNASIGSSAFSVHTQILFLPHDVAKLETWLQEGVNSGDEENNIACRTKVVVKYKCCDGTKDPPLSPKFGTMQMVS